MIEKYSRIYATIDLDAINFNMEQMEKNISGKTKIMGVIKTDGYGHGAIPIARALEPRERVCGFAVATAEEALILRNSGITKPILVLGYTFPYCYEEMIRRDISLTVFRWDTLKQLSGCVAKINAERKIQGLDLAVCKVHVKVDTGMTRIGISPDNEGIAFIKEVLRTPGIQADGIFTHFARADEAEKIAAKNQLSCFNAFLERIENEEGYHFPIRHISNSAGIVELKEANLDVVRAGITLYGLWPSSEVKRDIISLKPVMEIKSHIINIKEVEQGVPVSYGGTFITQGAARIATIPVGYGDGYPRSLSNRGYILVRGKRAPILGRVCMDQFMVDVTDIPKAAVLDQVTLIGTDQEEIITMEDAGEISGRFNYELACCIGKRVPRVYIRGGGITETKDYFNDF